KRTYKGQPTNTYVVLLKDREGWGKTNEGVTKMDDKVLTVAWNEAHGLIFSNLGYLKQHAKEFEFTPAENRAIKGQDCFAVRAKAKGLPEVVFYFDKKTRLLAKAEFRQKSIWCENYFGDYRMVGGVLHWHKLERFHNGQPVGVLTVESVRL